MFRVQVAATMTVPDPRVPPTIISPRRGRDLRLVRAVRAAAEELGSPLLDWQDRALDVIARYSKGRPAYPDALLSVSRQQGKTSFAKAYITGWADEFPESVMVLIAQTGGDARRRLVELGNALERSERWAGKVVVRRGVGNESIRWPNGSELWIAAPTETAIHGSSIDLIVADETWALPAHIMGAITPARGARPGSQMLMTSTAGIRGHSEVMERFRRIGRTPKSRIAVAEWSCPDELDVFDEANWPTFMPSFHEPFFNLEGVRQAAQVLLAHEFRRAYGNQWTDAAVEVLGAEEWTESLALVPRDHAPAFAFDVNAPVPGASIAASWPHDRTGTDWHVELVDHRPGESIVWLVDRMAELIRRHRPTAVFSGGGAIRGIAAEIRQVCEDNGVPYRTATLGDLEAASQLIVEGIRNTNVTHNDAAPLTTAALKGQIRITPNGWRFDRRKSLVDVSPILAGALAYMIGREHHAQAAVFVR